MLFNYNSTIQLLFQLFFGFSSFKNSGNTACFPIFLSSYSPPFSIAFHHTHTHTLSLIDAQFVRFEGIRVSGHKFELRYICCCCCFSYSSVAMLRQHSCFFFLPFSLLLGLSPSLVNGNLYLAGRYGLLHLAHYGVLPMTPSKKQSRRV